MPLPDFATTGTRASTSMLIKRLSVCAITEKFTQKIHTLKLCIESVLDLVRYPLARVGRAKHGTLPKSPLIHFFMTHLQLTDHADWPHHCATQLCDPIILRSDISGGKGGRNGPTTLGVLHVRALHSFRGPGSMELIVTRHSFSWAAGLFLYQTLDAIDGCVHSGPCLDGTGLMG